MHWRPLTICAFATLLAACGEGTSVRRNIAQQVTRGEGEILVMRQAAPFSWSRLYVFPPYSSPGRIEQTLGFSWSGARRSVIKVSDEINLLVFVEGKRVVESVELPRSSGDFYKAYRPQGFARDSAQFVVRREEIKRSILPGAGSDTTGGSHWVLYPVR
ncbi:MAG: hypothetical protein M3P51_02275 [Chloroflexota bacterium]|nr:hypothetical protein [Chloroflexota bacterium]